jgi:glycosyltransferase involved in cell wall biosynthesis
MEKLRICINTQTPLVQFSARAAALLRSRSGHDAPSLGELVEGEDYRYSPGGVTRMVLPLVRRLQEQGVLGEVHWISLNPAGPPTVRLPGIVLHHVSLPDPRMRSYGQTKEVIWGTVHGTSESTEASELFWSDEFTEYGYYNRRTAELIRKLDQEHDFDLFYIHDFQQLPIGRMLDSLKPKVLRWHIPFDGAVIPDTWRPRILAYLESYDAVVVSTKGYQESLRRFGYRGRSVRMYPYVDPADYGHPSARAAQMVAQRYGLAESDPFALVVARMDPMKGQDRAVRVLAKLRARRPDLRLVLVGNGSFSGSAQGLALTKSGRWRAALEALSRELGVADRVIFTGHATQAELDALYERSQFTILPSVQEGFGLVVIESWLHRRATIVTDQAGVAELVQPGENALLYGPDDLGALRRHMARLTDDPAGREKMGRAGRRAARSCTIAQAARAETRLIREVLEA